MKGGPDPGTEARWPVLVAVLAVGGIHLALPPELVLGPRWLLLIGVAALIIPAQLAHRAGRHDIDTTLGYAVSVVVTLGLVISLAMLLTSLPGQTRSPQQLLGSAAVLWVTNVLVFALWYWRLDAGGPHRRAARGDHTNGAFFFPQMMKGVPGVAGGSWTPGFVDYLFLAFNTSTAFSPSDTPVLSRWAKVLSMLQALISLMIVAILASRAVGLL